MMSIAGQTMSNTPNDGRVIRDDNTYAINRELIDAEYAIAHTKELNARAELMTAVAECLPVAISAATSFGLGLLEQIREANKRS